MAKSSCSECIHHEICYKIEHFGRDLETAEPCEQFISKDVAPVVHCKDCKYFHNEKVLYAANIIDEHADGICALRRSYTDNIEHTNVNVNDFCSYGERIAMDEIKLLPCPFCGGEAILSKEEIPEGNISTHTACIKCNDCGCATRRYIIDGYYKTPMRILTERIMTIECQACGAYPYVVSFTDDDETAKKNELTEKWNRRVYDK